MTTGEPVLTEEQLTALRQLVAKDQTVSWTKPEANAAFRAIHLWFAASENEVHPKIQDAIGAPLSVEQMRRFVWAYMHLVSVGVPPSPRPVRYYDDWQVILEELQSQSDRAAAIVGVALLDANLERAFRTVMLEALSQNDLSDLFEGPTAPLGSYSGKVRVAHAFGMIGDKSFADLKILGQVRNRFAHKLEIRSFEQEEIRQLCDQLRLADIRFATDTPPASPRERFINSIVVAAHLIYTELVAGTPLGMPASKSL